MHPMTAADCRRALHDLPRRPLPPMRATSYRRPRLRRRQGGAPS